MVCIHASQHQAQKLTVLRQKLQASLLAARHARYVRSTDSNPTLI